MFQNMVVNQRFDRCLTPMGTVPISVIYGFNYPVGKGRTPQPATTSQTISPSRGASRPVPVWPSSLSPLTSPRSQCEREKERKVKPGVRELRERNIKSVEPLIPSSPQVRRHYQAPTVTLRSRELPKRSYLSSWRESVR